MNDREIEIYSNVTWLDFSETDVKKMYNILDFNDLFFVKDGSLSVAFLNEKEMIDAHIKFLNDESLTDVITFKGDCVFGTAGEVCISPDYALRASELFGTTFSEELSLYLVHGYLHLAGLNDEDECSIKKMREAEKICLSTIKNQNAIPKFKIRS